MNNHQAPSINRQQLSPPLRKSKISKWLLGFLALFLLISGSYLIFRQLKATQQEASRPKPIAVEQSNLKVTVSANGTIEPAQSVNVSPKKTGILKELLVEVGESVTKGQIIAKMDDSELIGQLIEAQGQLAQAEANLSKLIAGNRPQEIAQAQARLEELEANLRQLVAGNRDQEIAQAQARLDSAKATYNQAEDDYQRNQNLQQEGAISIQALNIKKATYESAKATVAETEEALSLSQEGTRSEALDRARAEVKSQQQALDLLKEGTRSEEIAQARAEVLAAQGVLKTATTQIEDAVVRAPFDGTISGIYSDLGAFITPTTAGSDVSSATSSSILSLASENEVVANVAESNIAKIEIGQKVAIAADAFPGETFVGKVSQIATQASVEENVTSFEVTVALEGVNTEQLRAGMNASLDFQVDELKNVLTVPTIAVTQKDNTTGVYVGIPGQAPKLVPITTGASVGDRTEVTSGLDGSEHILVNVPTELPPPPSSGFSLKNLFGGADQPPGGGPPGGGPPGGGGAPPPM
jgi:HlyD family secretion protein